MKKKILSIMLIVAMLMGVLATDTFVVPSAANAATTGTVTSRDEFNIWINGYQYTHQKFSVDNTYFGACCQPNNYYLPKKNDTVTLTKIDNSSDIAKIIVLGVQKYSDINERLIKIGYAVAIKQGNASTAATGLNTIVTNELINQCSGVTVPENFEAYIGKDETKQQMVVWRFKPVGYAKINKTSSLEEVTKGNGYYGNIDDAEFGVYTYTVTPVTPQNPQGFTLVKKVATIIANGPAVEIPVGQYKVVEDKIPTNFMDFEIRNGEITEGVTKNWTYENVPKMDPIQLLLKKVKKDGTTSSKLAGAEYTVKYYAGKTATGTPKRTWVMKTDINGKILMDSNHKVSGDSFFYDKYGKVSFPYGTVTIQETKAPAGFILNPEVITVKVDGKAAMFTQTNAPVSTEPEYGAISIKKVDADTGNALANAEFTVYTDKDCTKEAAVKVPGGTTTLPNPVKTGTNGIATYGTYKDASGEEMYALEPGVTYYFKETKVPHATLPKRYILSTKTYPVTVADGKITPTQDIAKNESYGAISIKKIDAVTKKPLEGAEFTVYTDKACTIKANIKISDGRYLANPVTTDANGIATYGTYEVVQGGGNFKEVYALEPGVTYYFKETKAPEVTAPRRYILSKEIVAVKVIGGTSTPSGSIRAVPNEEYGAIKIQKIDAATKKPLAGAQFTVYSDADCTVKKATITTKADGWATYGIDSSTGRYYLVPGTKYYLKETKTPTDEYVLNTTKYVVTVAGGITQAPSVPVPNTKKGAIKIQKIDATTKEPLANAVFTVYSDANCTQKVASTAALPNPIKTGKDGWATYGIDTKTGYFALIPGTTYYLKETTPPSQEYVPSNDKFAIKVVSNTTTPYSKPVPNTRKGGIAVKKVDQDGKALAGVTFGVYSDSGCKNLVVSIVTKANGEATYGVYKDANGKESYGLIPGTTYYIKETKGLPGYEMSTEVKSVTVVSGQKKYTDVPFKNVRYGALGIKKVDQDGKNLAGAVFGVYRDKNCTDKVAEMTSKENGWAYYGWNADKKEFLLPANRTYYIKELKAPTGYVKSNETYSIYVKPGQDNWYSGKPVVNKEYGAISIKKIDAVTKKPLAGAEFTVYTDAACTKKAAATIPGTGTLLQNPVKSDANGIATYGTYKDKNGNTKYALAPDVTYYFKETKVPPAAAPKRYILSTKTYPVTVVSGKTTPTKDVAKNDQYGAIKIQKIDAATKKPLANAIFTVYADEACTVKKVSISTKADGWATFGIDASTGRYYLTPGTTYYLKETTPPTPEYVATNEKFTIKVVSGEMTAYSKPVENTKKGAIEAKKVDQDGKPLAGVTMGFYTDSKCTQLATVVNPITKEKLPNPVVTDAKGIATYGTYTEKNVKKYALVPDTTYYVKEVKGLPDYKMSTEIKSVKVVSGKTTPTSIPFKNEKYGKVGIMKVDTKGNPLAGATFKLYSDKDCTKLVGTFPKTSASGYAVYAKALPPGNTYYIKEFEAPEGYVKSDKVFTVTVKTNDTVYASEKAVNKPYGALSIKKVSQNNIPLAGAEFTIYSDEKCETVVEATAQLPNPIITDENGMATYGKYKNKDGKEVFGLVPGTTYYLKETKAPKGCIISKEKFEITIVSGKITPSSRTAVNRFPTGKIGINKTLPKFVGVTEEKVMINGEEVTVLTPKFAAAKEANVQFEIRAAEDIVTPDGVKIYSKDQLVDKVTTKSTTVYSRELDLGKYYIKEVKAPNGYIASTQVKYVTLTADENLHVENPIATIYNEKAKTEVALKKATSLPTITTEGGFTKTTFDKKPGEGFMFGLFADEDISLNGKVVIPKDSLVLTGKTDANGELTFTQDVPFGKYYVKELALPENPEYPWIMDQSHFPVDLTVENVKDGKIIIDVFEEMEDGVLVNSTTFTKISKKDIVSGKPVAGAIVVVKNSEGKVVFRGKTNKYGDTDKIYLPAGTYTFTEESAPNGYIKTDEEFKFTIGEDGKVTGTIKFTNEPVPEVKTTAMFEDDTKDSLPKGEITLIDKVEATNLVIGKEYTVKGTLVNQDDPTEIIATGETTFTATAKDMTVEVKFTFDGSKLEGTTTVVFEDLYRDGKKVATHTEISDEDQTTRIPKIRTKVGESVMAAESKVTLKDTLTYTNLTPGNSYKVEGKLMDKETGKPVLVNGKEVTSEAKFTPKTEDGTVAMTFMFDASTLGGKSVVVFEKVIDVKTGVVIGSHEDINDTNQTVDFPKVETTAMFEDGSKEALPGEKTTVVDKVKATNLTIGKEYTVKGTLVNVEDEKDIIATAETTFKATEKNMVIDVVFTFDSSKLEGESIVVFEDLEHNKKTVATHSEINDKDQIVHFPKAKTKVGQSEIFAGKVTLTDTITFKNLTPGEKHIAKGILVDKKGSPIKVDGKEITSETEFIPGSENGTVDVKFEFDAKVLEGTSIVVFEEILNAKGTVVAEHKDVNDENQTATVIKLRTKISKLHMDKNYNVTLTDIIYYEGLTVGEMYTAKGVLVDKTGKSILVDGKEITSTTTFTAEKREGQVEVTFKFNGETLKGKTVVVFEEAFDAEGRLIGHHKDVNDKKQAIEIPEGEKTVKTGDQTHVLLFVMLNIASLVFAMGIILFVLLLKRREKAE